MVAAGEYTEDLTIGHLSGAAPVFKNNLTIQAETAGTVTINAANQGDRFKALEALGADFGEIDLLGVVVNGDGVVLDGLRIVQPSEQLNILDAANINGALTIVSPNVVVKNCVIVGAGADIGGDSLGLLLANMDAVTALGGGANLALNLTVENTTFTNAPFSFAIVNFLAALGLPVPNPDASFSGCTFDNNGTGIEMDDGAVTVVDSTFTNNGTGISCSDDSLTVSNCTFIGNLEAGVEIETGNLEDNEAAESPVVSIDGSLFKDNGPQENSYGFLQEGGTATITNCIFSGNTTAQIRLSPDDSRDVTLTLDHCDLYNSVEGIGISTPESAEAIITVTITNTNISDFDCIENLAGFAAEFNVSFSNVFASNEQYFGEDGAFITDNVLNTDPMYVDAASGDFKLADGSPVLTAGVGGTFIGAVGQSSPVSDWQLQ
ncbi:MAG: right-handed parallel beta-helix repeat-containing protein [Candidatus Hinthialibacter antarcticus]|nr:right-handed parallel beta-helix repeat-containing protein [Candidatus Hinthialibacter antarcticus]